MRTRTLGAAACATFALLVPACGGGGGSNPTPIVSSSPTPTPAPTPTPGLTLPPGMVCNPTPPPLYGIAVKVQFDSGGTRKILDARPRVVNMNGFCGAAGFGDNARFCFTRAEGDPQAVACDYLAVGKASDTGRWGPTWYYNDRLCANNPGADGCQNHPDNQFLVTARGDGVYEACAADEIPVSTNPELFGSRCGTCRMVNGSCQ